MTKLPSWEKALNLSLDLKSINLFSDIAIFVLKRDIKHQLTN